jgi:hypothetical protein
MWHRRRRQAAAAAALRTYGRHGSGRRYAAQPHGSRARAASAAAGGGGGGGGLQQWAAAAVAQGAAVWGVVSPWGMWQRRQQRREVSVHGLAMRVSGAATHQPDSCVSVVATGALTPTPELLYHTRGHPERCILTHTLCCVLLSPCCALPCRSVPCCVVLCGHRRRCVRLMSCCTATHQDACHPS